MKDLINRSYQAIKGRGLIDENTTFDDFYFKAEEELNEIKKHMDFKNDGAVKFIEMQDYMNEWADLMNVCMNFFTHYNIDIKNILKSNVVKNEKRANEISKRK